jgi:hypothetical protein
LSRVSPDVYNIFVKEAIQKRLGTTIASSFEDLLTLAHIEKNLTSIELVSIPEQDGWVYSDGE